MLIPFIRFVTVIVAFTLPFTGTSSAVEFPQKFNPGHYLLVPLNSHHKCHDNTLWDCPFKNIINNPDVRGAQVRYTWRELEPSINNYTFKTIINDLRFLESYGKRLVIQIQDLSFNNSVLPLPDYIINRNGLVSRSKSGHIAKRWDGYVSYRFQRLLTKLGKALDHEPAIEVINLPETSVGLTDSECKNTAIGFSHDKYLARLKDAQSSLAKAFPSTVKLHYMTYFGCSNGWPYIEELMNHAHAIGIGYGGPDTVLYSNYMNNNIFPKIIEAKGQMPRGLSVQFKNYYETHPNGASVTTEELLNFGMEELELDYMFWLRHKPRLSELTDTLNTYVSPPSIVPGTGVYSGLVQARIKSKSPESVIYYTVDGSTPSSDSDQHHESNFINISERTLLKAIALNGTDQSHVATADFIFGDNLINNGDFESGNVYWQKIQCPDKCITSEPGSSNNSLRITGNGKWLVVRQLVPIKPNQKYSISGSLQTNEITKTARFSYRWLHDATPLISNIAFGKTSGTTDKTKYTSGSITSHNDATHLEINLRVNQGTGEAYFDDLKVVEVN